MLTDTEVDASLEEQREIGNYTDDELKAEIEALRFSIKVGDRGNQEFTIALIHEVLRYRSRTGWRHA